MVIATFGFSKQRRSRNFVFWNMPFTTFCRLERALVVLVAFFALPIARVSGTRLASSLAAVYFPAIQGPRVLFLIENDHISKPRNWRNLAVVVVSRRPYHFMDILFWGLEHAVRRIFWRKENGYRNIWALKTWRSHNLAVWNMPFTTYCRLERAVRNLMAFATWRAQQMWV